MKYQIFKSEDESWVLIEECMDDLALADRLITLRNDGEKYRAEKRDGNTAEILDV